MENSRKLPDNWASATLGSVGVWSGGGTPTKSNKSFWSNGAIPWVSPKDMGVPRIQNTKNDITEEAVNNSSAKNIPVNSVLMVTRSGILAHTFPVAVNDIAVTVNQDIKTLTPNETVIADYLSWYLRSQNHAILTECSKNGTTVASIDTDRLKNVSVPIAPSSEQRRIVEKIDTLFAQLDAGEAALRQVQTQLQRYRQSVLKAAVTGELTRAFRQQNAHRLESGADLLQRILETRRANWQGRGKYHEPVAPDTKGLPELPEGWVWASLGQICSVKGGVTLNKKKGPDDPVTLPYLRVANVQNGYLDLSEMKSVTVEREKVAQCVLQSGDILLNEGGDRDKLGRGWVWDGEIDPCIHQNHVFRARPIIPEIVPRFISYYTNAFGRSYFMQAGTQSVNLASISLTAISRLPVPLPPAEEQHELVAVIEQKIGEMEAAKAVCQTELTRSQALRQSILKQAFSGQLVPQDPEDEPASELLARIRAEREAGEPRRGRR